MVWNGFHDSNSSHWCAEKMNVTIIILWKIFIYLFHLLSLIVANTDLLQQIFKSVLAFMVEDSNANTILLVRVVDASKNDRTVSVEIQNKSFGIFERAVREGL